MMIVILRRFISDRGLERIWAKSFNLCRNPSVSASGSFARPGRCMTACFRRPIRPAVRATEHLRLLPAVAPVSGAATEAARDQDHRRTLQPVVADRLP